MIDVRDEGALRLVQLARPEKANALTRSMLAAVAEAARGATAAGARAMIVTAAGKTFSAGADLADAKEGLAVDPVWEEASASIAGFAGMTVAALNGTVAGGGFALALACDCRIAVAGAAFFYPVMRLGYRPQPSDPGRLVRLIGPSRAAMILLGGARITADEALAWGLVDRVVEPGDLMAAARALCADALSADPDHAARIKAMIRP